MALTGPVHIALFLGYSLIAIFLALWGADVLQGLRSFDAWLLGLAFFLVAAGAHELVRRRLTEDASRRKMDVLHHNQVVLRDRIGLCQRELEGLQEALESAAQREALDEEEGILNKALSELNLLKSLMPALSNPQDGFFVESGQSDFSPLPEFLSASQGAGEPMRSDPVLSDHDRFKRDGNGLSDARVVDLNRRRANAAEKDENFWSDFLPKKMESNEAQINSDVVPAVMLAPVVRGLDESELLDIVRKATREDRVELFMQPVFSLPQRKLRFYECFSRLNTPEGGLIMPNDYVRVARDAGLITAIDNMLLFRAVQSVRKVARRNGELSFFINLSAHSLRDRAFFDDFIEFIRSNQHLANYIILEFRLDEFLEFEEPDHRHLRKLFELGCRFSVDTVNHFDFDPGMMARRDVRFIRVTAEQMLASPTATQRLQDEIAELPVELVLEKVESEDVLIQMLDYDVSYGQGFLFGEPRPSRE
ncbi:EAL domain-containing protein [Kiloniella sp. b19]|uniref:EAL domain-containing protein n=1 Tax=Kiloniella sp. GXU_MW_B19 TaxID=3141326 RepID=UPI0031E2673E